MHPFDKFHHAPHTKYRPDIDGLRAVAILAVIGYHAFPEWIRGGFIGVDVFFVISGFLISTIIFGQLERKAFSLVDFYVRRIKRIFPALILVLIACLLFGWAFLLPDEFREAGKHVIAGALFLSNAELIKGAGYFETATESKPLVHLWSLAVEEQFYILWPLLMMFVWRRKWSFLAITLAIAAISFAANLYFIEQNPVVAYFSPISRFWELMIGGMLAYLALHRPDALRRLPNTAGWSGLLLLAGGLLLIGKEDAFPGWWALLPTLGAFLLIAAGPAAWANRKLLAHKWLVSIGLISYPLYLWHWLLLFAYRNLDLASGTTAFIAKLAVLALCFVLAWLTYRYIEQPVRSGQFRFAPQMLVAGMAAIGAVGLGAYELNGLPGRFKGHAEILSVSAEDFHWKQNIRHGVCNLDIHSTTRAAQCIELKRPMLLLWGDSHAASLYPGLKQAQLTHDFGLTQMTQNACGPFFSLHAPLRRADCNALNENILATARNIQPDIIVLHAAWEHRDYPLGRQELASKLAESVGRIHSTVPDARIVIIGPVPRWDPSLLKVIANHVLFHSAASEREVPDYLVSAQAAHVQALDQMLQKQAYSLGVDYISAYGTLCRAGGVCRTRAGSQPTDITAIDYGHLSRAGAVYLVDQVLPRILELPMAARLQPH